MACHWHTAAEASGNRSNVYYSAKAQEHGSHKAATQRSRSIRSGRPPCFRWTALVAAAMHGHTRAVDVLIAGGAALDAKDNDG